MHVQIQPPDPAEFGATTGTSGNEDEEEEEEDSEEYDSDMESAEIEELKLKKKEAEDRKRRERERVAMLKGKKAKNIHAVHVARCLIIHAKLAFSRQIAFVFRFKSIIFPAISHYLETRGKNNLIPRSMWTPTTRSKRCSWTTSRGTLALEV